MKHDRYNFFLILCHFLLFYPTNNSKKIKILKKMKKTPGDIIISLKCTKTHDQILYCSGDIMRDGCNYFSFWAIFCPFTPPDRPKIQN